MQIELSADQGTTHSSKIKTLNRSLICRSKKFDIQIEELSTDKRIVYRSKKYSICRSKKYLPINELDKNLICRLKNNLPIKELFVH